MAKILGAICVAAAVLMVGCVAQQAAHDHGAMQHRVDPGQADF
jgi:hypothetical protein